MTGKGDQRRHAPAFKKVRVEIDADGPADIDVRRILDNYATRKIEARKHGPRGAPQSVIDLVRAVNRYCERIAPAQFFNAVPDTVVAPD